VVDTEASPEHLSRATTEAVELMFVVAEPYFKSLETARRYTQLGTELGIDEVAVLANKVRTVQDREAVEAFCGQHGLELFAVIPYDEGLAVADREGVAPIDHDDASPVVRALGDVADRAMAVGP
jgi:CO dehydrogenase maturation factor